MNNLIAQVLKFAVVGGINTGVDWLILFLLSYFTGVYEGDQIIYFNIIAFTAAVINSYILNKRWTFKDSSTENGGAKFASFIAVSLVGVAINTGIVYSVSSLIDPMFGISQELWLFVGKAAATGVSMVWNFIGYKIFVFNR
jgi:putative flippase GtrA